MKRTYQEAVQKAITAGENRWDDFYIDTILWDDGDYKVEARHSLNKTDSENRVQERIRITPHNTEYLLVEMTETAGYRKLQTKEANLE